MDITLSLILLAQVAGSAVAIGLLAIMILWPINDQPTGPGQFIAWILASALAVALIFGKLHFHFSFS